MNKLMLLGSAAMLALSGAAFAQTAGAEPAPDAATAQSPAEVSAPADAASAALATQPSDAALAPAVAQSTVPAADAAAVPAAPSAPTTVDASAQPPAPAAPAERTATADAAAKVNAEWAKYDEGNKGKLTPLEFGNWVMAAKGHDVTAQVEKTKTSKKANLPAIKVLNETAADFAKADTDKDRMISPNELAIYLSA